MRTSSAIRILEEMHDYRVARLSELRAAARSNKENYVIAELSALELAIEVLAAKLLNDREGRAARIAIREHLPDSSC